jgi:hypothetical protein
MDHPSLMGVRYGVADLGEQDEFIPNREGLGLDILIQRLTMDVVHGKVVLAVADAGVMNRHDIGVIQTRR